MQRLLVAHIIAFIVTFVCATFALIAHSQFAASDIFFPMEFVKLANHDISHRLLPVVANILQILLNSFQNNVSGIVFFVWIAMQKKQEKPQYTNSGVFLNID